jgi:hydrogenase maturation protease
MTGRTVILGIGNTLFGDEGIGVHLLQALADCRAPAEADYLDGGTLSFSLLGSIAAADALLVVDAARFGAAPGAVQLFEGEDMDRFLGSQRKASVHEVGLLELMAMARLAGNLPARRALLAVQPQTVDWSESPSAVVAAAIPHACGVALDLLGRWQHGA